MIYVRYVTTDTMISNYSKQVLIKERNMMAKNRSKLMMLFKALPLIIQAIRWLRALRRTSKAKK